MLMRALVFGGARFDLRDPEHRAVAFTWPQFLASLLILSLW